MLLLYEGAVLAVLVVWAFLRSWRATLVAATALPLSVIPAFALMHYVFGFTINVVTLLSLSLVVGILWMTPSSRSRTSCATCAWARRRCRRPGRRLTRSGWR